MIAMPESVVLPLGQGREGATVRVHPLLTGEILAPPLFFKRPEDPSGLFCSHDYEFWADAPSLYA
jgi:hypothetical protein